MLIVKIELHSARTGKVSEIGRMEIANVTSHVNYNPRRGDYHVRVLKRGGNKTMRHGMVEDYPRLSYNVWRLVSRALRSAFPEEK